MTPYDWERPIKINLVSLKILGLWPNDTELYGRNFYTLYSAVCIIFFMTMHSLFEAVNIAFIRDDLEALTATFFIVFTQCLTLLKVYYFVSNISTLKQLMNSLKEPIMQPKTPDQRRLLENCFDSWKFLYKCYFTPVLPTLTLWTVYPLLDNSTEEHVLPFMAWYPYDSKKSPFYELTYLHQIICVSFMAFCNFSMDTLMGALMVDIGAQCDMLNDNLRQLRTNEEDLEAFKRDLIECAKHHRAILHFAKKSNKFFNIIISGQFLTSSIANALTMFQLTVAVPGTIQFFSLIGYWFAITMQIFFYCWFGNEVIIKSGRTMHAALESSWVGTPLETQKLLIFFAVNALEPIKLSAMNLFFISLETFMKIMQSAWSYFVVLRQVNGED